MPAEPLHELQVIGGGDSKPGVPLQTGPQGVAVRFDLLEGDPGVGSAARGSGEERQAGAERLDALASAGVLDPLHQGDAAQLRTRQNLPAQFPYSTARRQRLQWNPSPMLGGWYPSPVRGVNEPERADAGAA